ncbi:hypothetical protein P154DRAFT_531473 [Amniculicola lignicola CBS 123094]|uniref:NAD(P)-binding protein n=1 Tax=Amniculicola lignicola CBS 123094 TaxID=1392246 RepID=A0A6A5WTU5_9PLEO|nr:hypothetical protein P154DRAFT_531473 [Amniculicola lignicola CBS 123094]
MPAPKFEPKTNRLPKALNVCIIGASKGIGASIANAYAQAGAGGLAIAVRPSSMKELIAVEQHIKESNPTVQVTIIPCDITSSTSVVDLAKRVKAKFRHLDVVDVNSGYSGPVVLTVGDGTLLTSKMCLMSTCKLYTTNIHPMEAALESLKSLKPRESLNYTKIAKEYSIDQSLLSKRH